MPSAVLSRLEELAPAESRSPRWRVPAVGESCDAQRTLLNRARCCAAPHGDLCEAQAGKDPWKKELPTAENKKHDVVVVSHTMVDCSVYSIPGMVGGVAIVDSIIADPDNETFGEDSAQYV